MNKLRMIQVAAAALICGLSGAVVAADGGGQEGLLSQHAHR